MSTGMRTSMATKPALFVYVTKADQASIRRAAKKAGFATVSEYVLKVLKKDVDRRLAQT